MIGRVVLYYHPPPPLMSKSPDPSAVSTAHSFNKILNQYKTASKARSATDMEDATKKLRLSETSPEPDDTEREKARYSSFKGIISL